WRRWSRACWRRAAGSCACSTTPARAATSWRGRCARRPACRSRSAGAARAGPTSRSRTSAGACASPPSCGRGDRNWKGRGRSFTLEAMKRLARWFFQGLIYFVPIALTAFVLWVSFRTIDRGLGGLLGFEVPGAGFLLLVVLVTVLGFLLSNFLSRRLLRSLEG